MLKSLKRLTRDSAVYGISDVLGRSIAFLLVPIYTNVLATQEYGIVALIYAFIAFMNVFFTYGMEPAFLRSYILDETEKRRVLSTAYFTILLSTLVFAGIVYVAAPGLSVLISGSESLTRYIRMAVVIIGLDALNVIPFARLRAERRAVTFAGLKTGKAFTEAGCNLWLVVGLRMGVEGVLISNMIGSGLAWTALFLSSIRHLKPAYATAHVKELLKFGMPYIPAGASVIVIELIDRFMLERMIGTHIVGVYSAAYKLGVAAQLFVNMFRQAWQPFFLEISKQSDAKDVYARVLTYFTLIMSGLFLSISLFIDDVVRLRFGAYSFYGPDYWEGIPIVPVVLLSYITYGFYVNMMVGVYLEKKTGQLPFITGAAALVKIGSSLVLIPVLGMYGAACTTVLAYMVMVGGLYRVIRRYYPIRYEWGRILKICGVCGGLFLAGTLDMGAHARLYKLALLIGYPFALLLVQFFDPQEVGVMRRMAFRKG